MPNEKGEQPLIKVTVVVSGQAVDVRVNVHEPVANLVRKALHESGNQGQPPENWELRKTDGTLLDQSVTIAQAGITDGMTLFLSPRAGAGG